MNSQDKFAVNVTMALQRADERLTQLEEKMRPELLMDLMKASLTDHEEASRAKYEDRAWLRTMATAAMQSVIGEISWNKNVREDGSIYFIPPLDSITDHAVSIATALLAEIKKQEAE
jgi:hypothetical protein